MEKKILKFHIGRGGRFYNQGFMTFEGFEKITDGGTFNDYFFYDDQQKWFEGNGNELDCQINDDGTGYVNYDGDYDSTSCVWEDDLSEREINAILRDLENNFDEDELRRILQEHYPDHLED